MGDVDALTGECDRIESEFRRLEGRQETLEKEQAEIIRKTEAAAGDMEILARLKIETKQVAEAKRMNDRLLVQTRKKLVEVEKIIAMQRQSDMTWAAFRRQTRRSTVHLNTSAINRERSCRCHSNGMDSPVLGR